MAQVLISVVYFLISVLSSHDLGRRSEADNKSFCIFSYYFRVYTFIILAEHDILLLAELCISCKKCKSLIGRYPYHLSA